MPSLPALPSKPAGLRDDSAAEALYTKATHSYLNRDFSGALQTLDVAHHLPSPSNKVARKLWLLYIAVLDSTCSLDEGKLKEQFGREGGPVQSKLRQGTVWDETLAHFTKPPFEVMAALIMSSVRHMTEHTSLQQRVEDYLSTLDPETTTYERTMELYALHVLPKCNEWDYALEYIASSDLSQERKDAWTTSLGEIQDAEEAARQRAEADRLAQEQADKEERRRQRKRKSASSGSKRAVSTTTDAPRSSSPAKATSSTEAVVTSSGSSGRAVAASASQNTVSLWRRWSRTFLGVNTSLVRLLVFLAVLFGAAGRADIRARVLQGVSRVMQTVAMGLKVSYI